MNRTRQTLIDRLASDLPSGRRPWAGFNWTVLWLASSAMLVMLLTLLVGPLRPGVGEQLLTEPRFLIETLLGAAAIIAIGTMALRAAVPAGATAGLAGFAIALTILWLSNYVIGLYFPTMELGMLGKRDYCIWEVLLYALPTLALGFWIANKGYVLNWTRTGFAIGLVAGFIPGHLMQLACIYDAHHILSAHLAPVLPVSILGGAAGYLVERLPRRRLTRKI